MELILAAIFHFSILEIVLNYQNTATFAPILAIPIFSP